MKITYFLLINVQQFYIRPMKIMFVLSIITVKVKLDCANRVIALISKNIFNCREKFTIVLFLRKKKDIVIVSLRL
jgi:hypothetical protein